MPPIDGRTLRKPIGNPCPRCGTNSYASHSRPAKASPHYLRRRECSNPGCTFRWTTAEVPLRYIDEMSLLRDENQKLKSEYKP